MFFGFPLTSKTKTSKYHFQLKIEGVDSSVIFSQMRIFDSKRLQRKVRKIEEAEFESIKERFLSIFESK
jgi:mRNA-degrading endonuclease toxin of MazEF toxin-antitoxin module